MTTGKIQEVQNNIFMISGTGKSSHSYVIKGNRLNMLIDSGLDSNFQLLQESLLRIGLKVRDIDIVVNTHEHFDHIGANRYFQENAIIAAHRFAATKIAMNDNYVTLTNPGMLMNFLSMFIYGLKAKAGSISGITHWMLYTRPGILRVQYVFMNQ